MTLPVPNLDDRPFQDIVDEAKRLIPTYCPEWTNHNLTDPGVALIELFAWMTEMTLFRLNQVPDKFYTHMLNMMGFEPFPATAARTDLTFWLVDVVDEPVSVPAGTQVSTSGAVGDPRIFTTLTDLLITPAAAHGGARVARPGHLRRRVGRAAPGQPGRRRVPAPADHAGRPLLPRLRDVARRQRDPHGHRRQRRGHRRDPVQAAAVLGGLAGHRVDPVHGVPRHDRRPQPRRADHAARPAAPRAARRSAASGRTGCGHACSSRAGASRRTAPRRRSARSASTRSAGR